MWNVDEVGFRVGVGGNQWVLTLNPHKTAYIPSKTSRHSVTCVEAVNAGGDSISPMIIFPCHRMFESWFHNDLPNDSLLAVSETGYTDDGLALQWLKHFDRATKARQVGSHRLLILDGTPSNDIVLPR